MERATALCQPGHHSHWTSWCCFCLSKASPCTICTVLAQAVRPHLGAIAAKMEEMWSASQLSVSERNVLCDSMLAAAASGDPQLHSQVHLLQKPDSCCGCLLVRKH